MSRVRQAIRARLVALRDLLDRKRHPGRQRRAIGALAAGDVERLLFVCLGNVCRSPYAEYAARRSDEGKRLQIASAGFIGPGRHPPEDAIEAARHRGIEHADHVSKVLSTADIAPGTAVFIFDRFNAKRLRSVTIPKGALVFWLGDFDPRWTGKRAIIDPWGKPIEEFHSTFERIDRCVESLFAAALSPVR